MNRLWIITHPDHDTELTVIASSLKDACKYAADYYDEPDGASEYDGSESHKRGRRWVGVDNLSDAVNRLAELRVVGVDSPLIRVTYRGSIAKDAAMLWEIGCLDVNWCWLDPGVLCGGDQ